MSREQKIVIEADRFSLVYQLKEVWAYRELLLMLAYRDFKVKYAQAFLGFSWAILNPLINLILLSFVFHKVADVQTEGIPPLLFTMAGIAGWTYFAEVFTSAGDSILGAQRMIKKIYFPRLILPLSKAISALIELVIVLTLLFVLMLYYQVSIQWETALFPLFIGLAMLAGLTGGIWLSALTIRFRDFKYISPVFIRIGMFISPIAYSSSAVPAKYFHLYYLNPLVGIIEGFRWCLLGTLPPPLYVIFGFVLLMLFFIAGILYFNRIENIIADVI